MNNFMVDLETMGTKPYSIIASIGCVQFDLATGVIGEKFYATIDMKTCEKVGMNYDQNTVVWWSKQDKQVYQQLFVNTKPIHQVLEEFSNWLKKNCRTSKYMWGNSASFDLGLLGQAYDLCEMEMPWAYFNERCCRTIVALNPKIKDSMPKPKGAHHPIVDCVHQINYVTKTIKSIRI